MCKPCSVYFRWTVALEIRVQGLGFEIRPKPYGMAVDQEPVLSGPSPVQTLGRSCLQQRLAQCGVTTIIAPQ